MIGTVYPPSVGTAVPNVGTSGASKAADSTLADAFTPGLSGTTVVTIAVASAPSARPVTVTKWSDPSVVIAADAPTGRSSSSAADHV